MSGTQRYWGDSLPSWRKAETEVNDDIFIAFYEKEDAMQESLLAAEKAGKLSAEERKDYSDRLAEAFARLRGKLSFCNLK